MTEANVPSPSFGGARGGNTFHMDTSSTGPLRLTLTLPGSASLGAFQAGAVAGLAAVIRSLRRRGVDVHVDAVGGSSAGAFVATLFTHCLLTGRDATALLLEAWVDEVDMELLRSGGSDAPLATRRLRERIEGFIADTDDHPYDPDQALDEAVNLQIGLTTLLGFTAPIDSIGDESLPGLSYADWMEFELAPGHGPEVLTRTPAHGAGGDGADDGPSILDAVLASATHPAGFPPRRLNRGADREGFVARGITNFPDSGQLWYTDGGLVESVPAGRVIEAGIRRAASTRDARRLHLVVDPRSSAPAPPWSDGDATPTWLDGLRRSVSIVPTQALHDDLRRIASINERLATLDEVTDELADRFDETGHQPVDRAQLRRRLAAIGDLDGKRPVDIDMISPLLVAEDEDDQGSRPTELLAGDFIGAFGGFLASKIRRSDFALGWASTDRWWDRAGGRLELDANLRGAVGDDLLAARPDEIAEDRILDGSGRDHIGTGGRWGLTALAGQYARVLVGEALPGPRSMLGRWRDRLPFGS